MSTPVEPVARHPSRLAVGATLLVALLVACVPAATVVTRLPYREGATYVVEAGSILDVSTTVSLAEAGLDVSDVVGGAGLWIPSGGGEESAVAMTLWGFVDIEVDDGWVARSWDVRVFRSSDSDAPDAYRFELVTRIEVPREAYDLTRRVRGTWVARQGERLPFDVLVQATLPRDASNE